MPAGTDDVQFQCLQDALIREDKDMASTRMGVLEAGNTITVRAFQITRMLTRLGLGTERSSEPIAFAAARQC